MTNDQEQATANAASVTTPSDREVLIERVFDAPRERVYAAFTDPKLNVPNGGGPRDTTTIVDQMDVRPGGAWRFVHRSCRDGSVDRLQGNVSRGDAARAPGLHVRVGRDARPRAGGDGDSVEDLGGRTKVTDHSLFDTKEDRDGMLESGMRAAD